MQMQSLATFLFEKYHSEKYIQYENFLLINGFLRKYGCYNDIYHNTDDLVKIIEVYMSKLYLVHLKPIIPSLTDHDKQRHDKLVSKIDQLSKNFCDVGVIIFFPMKKILKCQILLYNEHLKSVFVISKIKSDSKGIYGTLSIDSNRLIDISTPNLPIIHSNGNNNGDDNTNYNDSVTTCVSNINTSDCKSSDNDKFETKETKEKDDINLNDNYNSQFVEYFASSAQCLEKKVLILDTLRYSKHDTGCGFGSILSYYINIQVIKNYCQNAPCFNKIGIFGINVNLLDLIIKKGENRISLMIDIIEKCIINSLWYQKYQRTHYLAANNDTFWEKFQKYYILPNKQIDFDNDSDIIKDIKNLINCNPDDKTENRMNVSKYASMCTVDTQFEWYLMGYDSVSDTKRFTSDEIEEILKGEQVAFNGHHTFGNLGLIEHCHFCRWWKLRERDRKCQTFTMHVCSNENKGALWRICDDTQHFDQCPPLKLKKEFEYVIFLEYNECTCANMLDFSLDNPGQDCGHFISVEFF